MNTYNCTATNLLPYDYGYVTEHYIVEATTYEAALALALDYMITNFDELEEVQVEVN